jgi:hypothetical protein
LRVDRDVAFFCRWIANGAPTVFRGFSEECESWKIICIAA